MDFMFKDNVKIDTSVMDEHLGVQEYRSKSK